MPSTNGHGPKRTVLYARVSTDEQARSGFSLAQQLEALREYATREGYEVFEEVSDPGQSGASLERPGMDRVRDLVAAGGVSVVLAQDRDRFAREPAYHYLLRREFEEHGTRIRALNDRGDDTPEGELTDGILDQLAKFERAKIAERTRRGKLRKAREGKIIPGRMPNYGFAFNNTRDHYVVDEKTMRVVRRIFRMVGVESCSIYHVLQRLDSEGVPSPTGGHWNKTMVRNLIMSDLYRPHTYDEIAELLSPDVAASLNQQAHHGVWWFNRQRVVATYVSESGPKGKRYRRRNKTTPKAREEWIAIPVPDAGIPRDVADAARKVIENNRVPSCAGRRFWQLSGRIFRCRECGSVMEPHTVGRKSGKKNFYYQCRRRYNTVSRDCANRKSVRAEKVEALVWQFISGLLRNPNLLQEGLEAMIEREQSGWRVDPERETRAWSQKLAEVARKRSIFQDMAADRLITLDELKSKLADLEEIRETAQRELEALSQRQEKIEQLERDKEELIKVYAGMMPEALDALTPQERHRIYKMLRLQIFAGWDGSIEVNGTLRNDLSLCEIETTY